jgi:hypothetical protein
MAQPKPKTKYDKLLGVECWHDLDSPQVQWDIIENAKTGKQMAMFTCLNCYEQWFMNAKEFADYFFKKADSKIIKKVFELK